MKSNPETKVSASNIHNSIIVLSGKGGVGKSTVAANLALSLALQGERVGLLDADIHGPSIPKLLNIQDSHPEFTPNNRIVPVGFQGLKVLSVAFLLRQQDQAIIWRGPLKMNLLKQFLNDVEWGELDYLIFDCPPGTGDEPLSVVQLLGTVTGAIVITTPQELSLLDVRKCINFCRRLNVRVLGIIENMSGFVCPHCGKKSDIFKAGGGELTARQFSVPFLGSIPIEPQIVEACDTGKPVVYFYPASQASQAFKRLADELVQKKSARDRKEVSMLIAIPLAGGNLSIHFGHCEEFALIEVDTERRVVLEKQILQAPDHQPGLLPRWLAERGVTLVIAGGMGIRAQNLFKEQGIKVITGAPPDDPEKLAQDYLNGELETGENICDH